MRYYEPGTPERYYRVQPPGATLDHRSETSNGEYLDGVFVFERCPSRRYIMSEWGGPYYVGMELVVILADPGDVYDPGDCEGHLLESGCGEIVERIPWCPRTGWFKRHVIN